MMVETPVQTAALSSMPTFPAEATWAVGNWLLPPSAYPRQPLGALSSEGCTIYEALLQTW